MLTLFLSLAFAVDVIELPDGWQPMAPAWSLDGTRLAMLATKPPDPQRSLWVVDAENSAVPVRMRAPGVAQTDGPRDDYGPPVWHPSGVVVTAGTPRFGAQDHRILFGKLTTSLSDLITDRTVPNVQGLDVDGAANTVYFAADGLWMRSQETLETKLLVPGVQSDHVSVGPDGAVYWEQGGNLRALEDGQVEENHWDDAYQISHPIHFGGGAIWLEKKEEDDTWHLVYGGKRGIIMDVRPPSGPLAVDPEGFMASTGDELVRVAPPSTTEMMTLDGWTDLADPAVVVRDGALHVAVVGTDTIGRRALVLTPWTPQRSE